MSDVMRVPQPPTKPFVGNLFDVDTSKPVQGLMKLAETYGGFLRCRSRVMTCISPGRRRS